MHMVAVVAVCRNALVGTGWSNSALFAQIGLENTARIFISRSKGCFGSEWVFIAPSTLGFSFAARALTELKIWCVVGMHMLKVV